MLMSAAISPHLKEWKKSEIVGFAFQLTDETFAVLSTKFTMGPRPKSEVFGLNITTQAGWLLGTWLGITAGQFVGDVEIFALDYALPAMFVALVVIQIERYMHVFIAILTAILSVVFLLGGAGQWHVIRATLSGASVGVMVEKWTKKTSL
jgi:predicted branched-subunit amino acid permease